MARFEQIKASSILSRTIIERDRILTLHTIKCTADGVVVTPFDIETAGTVFEDNPIAVLSKNSVATDNTLSRLSSYLNKLPFLNIPAIQNYLKSNDMFYILDSGNATKSYLIIRFVE